MPPDSAALARIQREFGTTYGDWRWRIRHLYPILDKNRKIRYLKPNNIQTAMERLTEGMDPLRALFLKYRQGGVSTYWLIRHLDDTIWTPNTITGVLAHKQDSLKTLFGIIRNAYKGMPPGLRPPLAQDTLSGYTFGAGVNSRIFVALDIRSTPVHNLHVSEWAHCDDADVQASVGAVPPTGNITGETTANGVGNDAHITYAEGKLNLNEFRVAFYPWFIQSEYRIPVDPAAPVKMTDEETRFVERAQTDYGVSISPEQVAWRRSMRKKQKGLMPQEFPESDEEAFMSSGKFFFDQKKAIVLLNELRKHRKDNPPVEETDDWVAWEKPIKGDVYVAGADVAEGLGLDFSVLAILNLTKRRMAARLRAQMGVGTFARQCAEKCRAYRDAILAVEDNNHGKAVNSLLDEVHGYQHLYREKRETRLVVKGNAGHIDVATGWKTTPANRTPTLDALKLAIEGEDTEDVNHFAPEFEVLDEALLLEMLKFREVDGKMEAGPGAHDDTIFAWAICNRMRLKYAGRVKQNGNGGSNSIIAYGRRDVQA